MSRQIIRSILFLFLAVLVSVTCKDKSTDPVVENDAPQQPYSPSPVTNATDISVTPSLSWSCSDPDGDNLTYDVYFGTTTSPSRVSSGQSAMTYSPGLLNYFTRYYWKVVAKDDNGATATSSTWTFVTLYQQPTETITTPNIPTGPSEGFVDQSLEYTAGGSTCSLGHIVQYRFDWGDDGEPSAWSAVTTVSHTWTTEGTYDVRAQARCSSNTSVVSDWSEPLTVTITVETE